VFRALLVLSRSVAYPGDLDLCIPGSASLDTCRPAASCVENLAHAVSLHYMYYNFARVHQSLTIVNDDGMRTKRTPAMAAGVADHVWTLREIAALLGSN
jgi:hypothetical protein